MKKTICLALMTASLLIGSMAYASQSPGSADFSILIDGKKFTVPADQPQPYMNQDNRIMVPIRYLTEALGIPDDQIKWDEATQTVTIHAYGTIRLTVGSYGYNDISNQHIITVMDSPIESVKGRVFLPVRWIVVDLGAQISWDESTKTVNITTDTVPTHQ